MSVCVTFKARLALQRHLWINVDLSNRIDALIEHVLPHRTEHEVNLIEPVTTEGYGVRVLVCILAKTKLKRLFFKYNQTLAI